MFRHLLRPFSYLSIEHKQKWQVDWVYPLVLALLSTGILFGLKRYGTIALYADGAVIAKILGFVQGLPGFYIAALAAIATFNKTDIDKTMPSPAPRLDILVQGKVVPIELTRRRFFVLNVCLFLTAESLVLIILAIFGQAIYVPVKTLLPAIYHSWTSSIYMLIFSFFYFGKC